MLERLKNIIDIEKLKAVKNKKQKAIIALVLVCVIIIGAVFYTNVIGTSKKYNEAMSYYNEYNYKTAEKLFKELGDYKDSADYAKQCNKNYLANQYNHAVSLFNEGKYDEAMKALEDMPEYENSKAFYEQCKAMSKLQKEQANIDPQNAAYYSIVKSLKKAHGECKIVKDPNNKGYYSVKGLHTIAIFDADNDGTDELLVGWCDDAGDKGTYSIYTFDGVEAKELYDGSFSTSGKHYCYVLKLYNSTDGIQVYKGDEDEGYTVSLTKDGGKKALTWKKSSSGYKLNGKKVSKKTYYSNVPRNYTVQSPVENRVINEDRFSVYAVSYMTKSAALGKLSDAKYYYSLFEESQNRMAQD